MARLGHLPDGWTAILTDADWRALAGGRTVVHQRLTDRQKPTKYHGRDCPHAQHRVFREALATGLQTRSGSGSSTSPAHSAEGPRRAITVSGSDRAMNIKDARAGLERCQLRFPTEDIPLWAERYAYRADDQHVIDTISAAVRERGHFRRDEFLETYRWKTERTARYAERHTEEELIAVVGLAFRQRDEKLKLKLLCALDGVDVPVASALLHVGLSEDYPIIDYRALWSLNSGQPSYYSYEFWWLYVECCRRAAAAAAVSVRELDKALWAYSDANQPGGTR